MVNAAHLGLMVGNKSLRDWISTDPHHGKLLGLNSSLHLWSFEHLSEGPEFLKWNFPAAVRARNELAEFQLFPWQQLAVD